MTRKAGGLLEKFFRYFFYSVMAFGGMVFMSFVGFLFWIGDAATSCGKNSEAVAYARSLTKERLEKLYLDMEEYSTRTDLPIIGYAAYGKTKNVPEVFSGFRGC